MKCKFIPHYLKNLDLRSICSGSIIIIIIIIIIIQLIKGINTRAIPFVRYSGPFLKIATQTNGPKDKKAYDDAQDLTTKRWQAGYICREKKGGRWFASIQDGVDASIHGLKDNFKKSKERLIPAVSDSTDNVKTKGTTTNTRKQKSEEKQLHKYFKGQIGEISYEKTWLRKGNL